MGLLSGCAGKETADWGADKPVVVDSLQGLNSNQQEQKEKIARLEQLVIDLDAQVKKQQAIIEALSASLESVKHSKKVRTPAPSTQREKKLADKLKQVEASLKAGGSNSQAVNSNAEKNAYTNAYLALKSGRYEEATGAFKALLGQHPDGEYSDQALYWLGESYLALNKPKDAVEAFSSVVKQHPTSAKYGAALLKLATAYLKLGRSGDSKATLQRLLAEQPDGSSAAEARNMLKSFQGSEK